MPKGRPLKFSKLQEKRKKKQFLEVLEKNLGIITPCLKIVGISYWTYYKWVDEDPDFKDEVENIKEKTIDFVESKLFNLISEGDKTAIIFYLKTKAKHRGYIERIEQETTYTQPIKFEIIPPENQLDKNETILIDDKKLLKK